MNQWQLWVALTVYLLLVVFIKLAVAEIPYQDSDGEILAVLSVIDENDIQASQLAEQKKLKKPVIDFARMLDKDHTDHLDRVHQISQQLGIATVDNKFLDGMRAQHLQDMDALKNLDANSFSQLYLADMVKGLSEGLNWIANQKTQDKQLDLFLQETRKDMSSHLKKAQSIQTTQGQP